MRTFFVFLSIFLLVISCKSQPPVEKPEKPAKAVPTIKVKEPVFEVVSIAIIKAELINTQFEAIVKIENQNDFALDLKSLTYELYGNGAFWASGKGLDILHIPAGESCQTKFYFTMNFINMSRKLLDDIIDLRQVNYRFAGTVEVAPDMQKLSSFYMKFEESGFSIVKEKA